MNMMVINWIEIFRHIIPILYILLTASLILSLFFKKTARIIMPAVFFIIGLNLIKIALEIFGTYFLWKQNGVSKFLLPPYKSIDYFIKYIGFGFLKPFLISLLFGLIFYLIFSKINDFRKRKFFEDDEPMHCLFGILILGHPLWIIYVFAVFLVGIIIYLIKNYLLENQYIKIFSLYNLWLFMALVILLFNKFFMDFKIVEIFRL